VVLSLMTTPICEVCGDALNKNASRFCSHLCRGVWSSRQAAELRAARPESTCDHCGEAFRAPHTGTRIRRTCSKACRYALVAAMHRASGTRPPPATPEQRQAARERFSGPNHPCWVGGKYTTDRGYVYTRPAVDFPFPEMVDRRGYIREHRMVMAMHLGRALERREVIHHVNGSRADNRLENLRLHASHSEHMRAHH
jgi:hypothetical protein